jgi:hypothetical protein
VKKTWLLVIVLLASMSSGCVLLEVLLETAVTGPPTSSRTVAIKDARFVGNTKTRIIHANDCPMTGEYRLRIYYFSLRDAIADGFTSCEYCAPELVQMLWDLGS